MASGKARLALPGAAFLVATHSRSEGAVRLVAPALTQVSAELVYAKCGSGEQNYRPASPVLQPSPVRSWGLASTSLTGGAHVLGAGGLASLKRSQILMPVAATASAHLEVYSKTVSRQLEALLWAPDGESPSSHSGVGPIRADSVKRKRKKKMNKHKQRKRRRRDRNK
mmetsp:Transcript_8108/g.23261  ORF Transcript_8108/g.23261 Transcript_8108/m.23261 type:complete len:168 (+) Transcript_8108:134-637(+)